MIFLPATGQLSLEGYPDDTAPRVALDILRRNGKADGSTTFIANREAETIEVDEAVRMIGILGQIASDNPTMLAGAAAETLSILACSPEFPMTFQDAAVRAMGTALQLRVNQSP